MNNILFEDQYLLVINKPAGLSTESGKASHPSAETEAGVYLSGRLKGQPYVRAVHRLDRPVSGVLVFAKTKAALTTLMLQFEQGKIKKAYQALVETPVPYKQGQLSHFIKRDETGKKALVFDAPTEGAQPCTLDYNVLKETKSGWLLEITPHQGRFHQIRAQLAHSGCPVAGDVAYGGRFWKEHEIKLHAVRLTIHHPKTGDPMVLEAPIPSDWQAT